MPRYLKQIKDNDIFPKSKIKKPKKYTERQTVRVIALNNKNEVALVTNAIHNLYSLPGGGAESNNLELEVSRECLEEINQEVKIIKKVGKTKEFRDRDAKEYTTTCFVVRAIKKVKKDFRTDEEKENGLKVVWVNKKKLKKIFDLQNARVKDGEINFYNTAFNIVRDKIFIYKWLETTE